MPFVNEKISDEDVEKFGICDIDDRHMTTGTRSRHWTIDRDKNIYLRRITKPLHHQGAKEKWTFFWKGHELTIARKVVEAGGKRGGSQWAKIVIEDLNIPSEIQPQEDEIKDDLICAFTEYKGSGIYATATDYKLEVTFS